MKKFLLVVLVALLPSFAAASGGAEGQYIVEAPISLTDKAQLQRGAQLFVNYCYGCHSMKYLRYERMATDLDIPLELLAGNMMFNTDKPGEPMRNALDPVQGKAWFGVSPPDLTLEAKLRGSDWVYSYLINFYEDSSRPWGVNNHVFPNVGMPHVLWELQGERRPVFVKQNINGHEAEVYTGRWETVKPGQLDPVAYDDRVANLVAYLQSVN